MKLNSRVEKWNSMKISIKTSDDFSKITSVTKFDNVGIIKNEQIINNFMLFLNEINNTKNFYLYILDDSFSSNDKAVSLFDKHSSILQYYVEDYIGEPEKNIIQIPIGFESKSIQKLKQYILCNKIVQKDVETSTDISVTFKNSCYERRKYMASGYLNIRPKIIQFLKQYCNDKVYFLPKSELKDYLNHYNTTLSTISPFGNGLDCHRHYECMLKHSLPIIFSSPLDKMYIDNNIPCIIIKSIPDLLKLDIKKEYAKWNFPTKGIPDYLTLNYWLNKNKFIKVSGKKDGFGAQLFQKLFGICFAKQNHLTYIHTPFKEMEHVSKDKMTRLETFIDLSNFIDNNTIEAQNYEVFEASLNKSLDCIFTDENLSDFKNIYFKTDKPFIQFFEKNSINCAVHIRRGDVHKKKINRWTDLKTFEVLMKKLELVIPNIHFHIFSEGKQSDFIFDSINSPISLHINTDIEITFHSLVSADILIPCRSCLSFCAALFSSNLVIKDILKGWWHKPLTKWTEITYCHETYTELYNLLQPKMNKYLEKIEQIVLDSKSLLEGNCFYKHNSLTKLPELIPKQINIFWSSLNSGHKICEIGFNAGHSSLLLSLTDYCTHLEIFDTTNHNYFQPSFDFLKHQFPHINFNLNKGESLHTLPLWIQHNTDLLETFSLIHIDGCHKNKHVFSDIINSHKLLQIGGLMIINDTNCTNINNLVDTFLNDFYYYEEHIILTPSHLSHRILRKFK